MPSGCGCISRRRNGKGGSALLCPVTSQVKGYPFEVLIPEGLAVSGAVLADQVKSLDWRAREAEFACFLPAGTMREGVAENFRTAIIDC